MRLVLHGYWRSGTSYRTRIALHLKDLAFDQVPVDLRAGEQHQDTYLSTNPQGLVPTLEADGRRLIQSPAIIEWLEERFPDPPLLPQKPEDRAVVRGMAAVIGCDIHPLNNMRVLQQLRTLGADEAATGEWTGRWITEGFSALEALIGEHGKGWSFGDTPSLADCYLIPQVYSAQRFIVDLHPFPRIVEVAERASEHPAFIAAHPENQPDA
jgi:maleylpyruvate isomerase